MSNAMPDSNAEYSRARVAQVVSLKGIPMGDAMIKDALDQYRSERCLVTSEMLREQRLLLDHIHRRLFDSGLTIGGICRDIGIRNHNASSRFKRATGYGMKSYIELHRITAARVVLSEIRGVTVFDVAMAVGYKDVETFYQAWSRHFDETPGSIQL